MRWTLKEILRACRAALKKNLNKRDKWIKEWPGQVRDTTQYNVTSKDRKPGILGPYLFAFAIKLLNFDLGTCL